MLEYQQNGVVDSCVFFELKGEMASNNVSQQLGQELRQLAGKSPKLRVLFNCQALTRIDSAGIGLLLIYRKVLESVGGAMALFAPKDGLVPRTLRTMELHHVLHLFEDQGKALDYLQTRHMDGAQLPQALSRAIRDFKTVAEEHLLQEVRAG